LITIFDQGRVLIASKVVKLILHTTMRPWEGIKMKKMPLLLICLFVILLSVGCVSRSRVADLTIAASKNISSLEGAVDLGIHEGKACKGVWSGTLPSMEDALDEAVERGGGNAMTDAVIYFKPGACLFDKNCWEVKGRVIKTKDLLTDYFPDGSENSGEFLTSKNGHIYYGIKKRAAELNYGIQQYDFILRIQ
jgi:hypothetical protein